ncbi:DUF1958 domain-containing protein [Staphylococcus taiwanensis]|nr:DUF1958 domain-containing protein [Staphylococcus taiwanensis]
MFRKSVKSIGVVSLACLLYTSTTMAAEKPLDIVNKDKGVEINTSYQPSGLTVATQQGQILYNFQGNKKVDPASLSKTMTVYLTLEAVEQGKLKLNDKVKISAKDAQISNLANLSSVPLTQGDTYTIKELIKQAMLASSNSAAIILGEQVSGSTSTFTEKMNQQAKDFKMTNTSFINPAGADNAALGKYAPSKYQSQRHPVSTAKDINILMHHMIAKHPEILDITKMSQDTQKGNTFKNTNLSVKGNPEYYRGTDGLKTGTSDTGYSIALTNHRDHMRLNATVMNVQSYPDDTAKKNKSIIGNHMIQHYRQQYEYEKVVSKGDHKIDGRTYHVKKDLYDVVPKNKKKWTLAVNNDGKVYVHYKRDFLLGTKYPRVAADKKWKWF